MVTKTSRLMSMHSASLFAEATAGDENSVLAECATCARLYAFEAVTGYAG